MQSGHQRELGESWSRSMALIECPECKEQVSDNAVCCPKCGYGIRQLRVRKAARKSAPTILTLTVIVGGLCSAPFVGRWADKKNSEAAERRSKEIESEQYRVFKETQEELDHWLNRSRPAGWKPRWDEELGLWDSFPGRSVNVIDSYSHMICGRVAIIDDDQYMRDRDRGEGGFDVEHLEERMAELDSCIEFREMRIEDWPKWKEEQKKQQKKMEEYQKLDFRTREKMPEFRSQHTLYPSLDQDPVGRCFCSGIYIHIYHTDEELANYIKQKNREAGRTGEERFEAIGSGSMTSMEEASRLAKQRAEDIDYILIEIRKDEIQKDHDKLTTLKRRRDYLAAVMTEYGRTNDLPH